MSEISKIYDFKKVEDKIYAKWEKSGYFNPDNLKLPERAKSFTIILPPPNITDKLHMGHASMLAIEDLLIRYKRMKGFRTLWLPGTDHASIATQNVVEKKLLKEKGLSRHDLGREKFLKEVWLFLRSTQKTILNQIRKMGSSLDFSREAFTLDEARQKAVARMFVEMYEEGLIYEGKRLVNWCPRCHSTLADDEVEYKEQEATLYTFKYSKDFPIAISTTRPETKLGDTAIAVNPKDARYKKYIGETIETVFCGVKLKIKIIADREVDKEFGTGAVGVTPAHSFTDSKMAEKNSLKTIEVISEDGKIKEGFGKFSGKTVLEARKMIVEELKKDKIITEEKSFINNLSICYRCGEGIEPLLSNQWFVAVDKKVRRLGEKSLKEKALEVARKGKIRFIPERFEARYTNWMENLHDWCISRQIWFGHNIPVWRRKTKTNLILIRHAQTDWNVQKIMQGQTDIPLNKTGKKQAKELRETIRKEKVDVIIISPLKRTRQTAKILNTFKLPIIEDDRLKERNYGKFEGMKTEEMLARHPEITTFEVGESLYWIEVPTAETYAQVRARVKDFLEDINKKYSGKNVMLVSHGDTLDMFYAELNNVSNEKAYGKFSHNAKVHKHSLASEETYVGEKAPRGSNWKQDPDTLDTWFSSGMWTFSTLGWPDNFKNGKKRGDLKKFHPTQVLETGYDILTLWVSRMIMMSLFAIGEVPFENVYLHGLVLDKNGKKMSKSKGNGIDPLDMIEKYGADAVRLALLIGNTPGNDTRMFEKKIEGFRNFVTKIWNITRFCQMDASFHLEEKITAKDMKTLADRWIVSRLEKLIKVVSEDIEKYQFSLAGEKLREFTWSELADWYIEISKKEKNLKVLGYVLDRLLRLWHPFMPYVTEEIYGQLGKENLLIGKWPEINLKFVDKKTEKEFARFQEKISAGRIKKVDKKKEEEKKNKEAEALNKIIAQKEALLRNAGFLKSAPKSVIEENKKKLEEYKGKLRKIS